MKMKNNKILIAALAALSLFAVSSCVVKQEDVFDQPASARLTKAINDARDVLKSAPNGWWMAYYPHSERTFGGFVMTLEFTDQEVKVGSELESDENGAKKFETSYYKLTNDSGPVLTVDTYNSLFHHFATPSADEYEAKGGDFEFMILSASEDCVRLKGKRSGNIICMYPLQKPASDYLKDVFNGWSAFIVNGIEAEIAGGIVHGEFELNNRQLSFGRLGAEEDELISTQYVITPDGILLYEPIEIQGATFQKMVYNAASQTVLAYDFNPRSKASDETKALPFGQEGAVVFTAIVPGDDYVKFEDFVGNYTIHADENTANGTSGVSNTNVTLVSESYNRVMLMRGVNSKYDVELNYDLNTGSLTMMTQYLGSATEEVGELSGVYLYSKAEDNMGDSNYGGITVATSTGYAFVGQSPATDGFLMLEYRPNNAQNTWWLLRASSWAFAGSRGFDFPLYLDRR